MRGDIETYLHLVLKMEESNKRQRVEGDTSGSPATKLASDDGSGDNGTRQGIIALNDLTYQLQPDLSVAVNNTYKKQYFQNPEYSSSQRAVCIWNTGADYIDTRSSFLRFHVKVPSTFKNYFTFGETGSALNLINQITISSRSGDELCRIQGLNQLNAMITPYRYDEEWMHTVGQMAGFGTSKITENGATFAIPLYLLSDMFGYGRLLPSMVASGLRIEIDWEKPSVAFEERPVLNEKTFRMENNYVAQTESVSGSWIGTGIYPVQKQNSTFTSLYSVLGMDDYTIDNIVFDLKSVQLTDGTQRALNEISAVNGLEIVYTDFERTQQTFSSNMIHMEVRKAASRAMAAYARVTFPVKTYFEEIHENYWYDDNALIRYDSATEPRPYYESRQPVEDAALTKLKNSDFHMCNFDSAPWDVADYQWQLGSLYFPNQPCKTHGVDQSSNLPTSSVSHWKTNRLTNLPSAYAYTLDTFNCLAGGTKKVSVPLNQFFMPLYRGPNERWNTFNSKWLTRTVTSTSEKVGLTAEYNDQQYSPTDVCLYDTYDSCVVTGDPEAHPTRVRTELDGNYGTYANGRNLICCSLERSNLFNLTGVPINNSRVLALRATFDNSWSNRKLTIYLKYVKLTRCFLNNIEVEQ